mgnify:CR=1 FL=1
MLLVQQHQQQLWALTQALLQQLRADHEAAAAPMPPGGDA